jgi:ABC-type nitrate/sulfonate/bicarbonate transport system ATPase subunit
LFSYRHGDGANHVMVIDGISLSVAPGSFVSILGPSGCGKSTLLKLIAGLLKPDSGSVTVDGNVVDGPSPDRTVIFQEYGLFDWKTVRGNVEFGLKAKGMSRSERHVVSQHYIDLVHLRGREDVFPRELSGGMKQRAAIARALAVQPRCILMDEPFGALDAQTRLLLQEEILDIWEQTKNTIIMVTHSIEEAVYLSDRVVVLSALPARVVTDVRVELLRPRTPDIRYEPQFKDLTKELWSQVRDQVGNYHRRDDQESRK